MQSLWVGRALFGLSLLLYVLTLSPGFFAGQSTAFVAAHLGVEPFPPLVNHVWGWLIRLVAAIPIGPMAIRIHLVDAVCSATSVWLLFQIVIRLRHPRTFEEGMPRAVLQRVRLLSALVSGLVLATAIPFWMAATRAHPLAFDLMLMLLSFHLLLRYGENGRPAYVNTAVLVYAVGMTDFATLVLFLPVFGLLTLYHLYRYQQLRVGTVLRLLALALVGLAPQFIAAAFYMKSDAFVWRQFSHYGQVLWYMWRDQYMLVLRSLPRIGWLTVGVVSLLPWLAVYVLGIGRRSVSAGAWLGTAILCGLLTLLAGLLLTNTLVSPWAMTRDTPLLITPYVLIAMWTGSVAGYWLAVMQRGDAGFWRGVGFGYAGLLIVSLAALGFVNEPVASGKPGRWFASFAREVVDRLDGRRIVISTGIFDDVILLEARARHLPLDVINLRAAQQLSYRRYVASLFPDDVRLRSLAEVGVQPLLVEWFAKDTNIAGRVAVLDVSDLWMAAGMAPEPHGPLYLGRTPSAPIDIQRLADDNRAFWKRFAEPLSAQLPPESHPVAQWLQMLCSQSAKSANNLGVLFDEAGQTDLAVEAYNEAHQFNPQNISALVNLHALYQRESNPEATNIETQVDALISRDQVRRYLWSLSYHHGIIRSPELYASRGWAWAMSGKPALAAQDLRKALDLGGDSSSLRLALAALDADSEGPDSPEEILQAELDRDPKNVQAALGLYRLAVRRGQFEVARGRLQELRRMENAPEETLQLEDALLDILTGNMEQAAGRLSEFVRKKPDDLRAWAALAVVAGQQNDAKTVQEALDRLQQARSASPAIRYMAAQLALKQGDRTGAQRQLEQLLRQEPRHAPALELMVRLLMFEGDRENAERYVERLISVDPQNSYGNYMLGAFQALRGQYALAESSYRVSLRKQRGPAALNDLAYVLARQQQYDEALSLIEECIRINNKYDVAWSTYGMILLSLNRLDEAEAALQEALSSYPESVEVQLNLAQLYEKQGKKAEALQLAESIMSRSGELLRDDQDALRELLRRLRGG